MFYMSIWAVEFYLGLIKIWAVLLIPIKIWAVLDLGTSIPGFEYQASVDSSKMECGTWVNQTLRSIVTDSSSLDDNKPSLDQLDAYYWRVELVYRELLVKEASGQLQEGSMEVLRLIEEAYRLIGKEMESYQSMPSVASVILDGSVGRPRFAIPHHQVEYLINAHFTVPQISSLLGVSPSTIRRRMRECNITIRNTYSNISDAELDGLIATTQQQFPNWGNRLMYGYLLSRGIRLQFQRVRDAQHRIDPEGSAMRGLYHLRRRHYSVPGPQHLWHMDGNHKLIRYSISYHTMHVYNMGTWCQLISYTPYV